MRRARFCMLLTGLLMAGPALADDGWQKTKEEAGARPSGLTPGAAMRR